jgi:hypothetical protein
MHRIGSARAEAPRTNGFYAAQPEPFQTGNFLFTQQIWDRRKAKYQSAYRASVKYFFEKFLCFWRRIRVDIIIEELPDSCCIAALLLRCCCPPGENSNKTAIQQQYSSNTAATNQLIYKKPPGNPNPDKKELQCRKNENKFYRASVCTLIFRLYGTAYLCNRR